ncbi:MAG: nucleobase:cation symporter-2 family protein [Brevibacterium aurantiacum]|uniref:Nucleobase:cation symporter-2, NCS2 family n=1 Tax=Brevibacterium aurantiacum TaxID=273384 RepID=A0A1D7VYF5_BREAU|nr:MULTISPECIES: nucleobase:cation symporter-2 family protein [Brevibacterium]MDN5549928.1 purine permease [Brevibacterium sp.]AOP51796.1 Xanthine permease [Brevibacterium aurantiacum]AZL04228.1 purine permease [Brevibacterium aurantiacum]AZL11435.1 purine permease [Brevibacterium aurantiacum]AZT91786.1 purine permease [Brevibacterium aurantiacum]
MSTSKQAPKGKQAEAARPEDERLPVGTSFAYGLQHVLTMYGGIIAVPLIIGKAAGLDGAGVSVLIASCLFVGGLATILQSFGVPFFGSQLPLVQGVSFAGVATMTSILAGGEGLPEVFGAVLVASAIGLIVAPGFALIVKFFPPVVTGTVITTIGLSLMPVAAGWAMGGNAEAPDYGSGRNILIAVGTLAIVLILSRIPVAAISRLSILLAIVVGTVVCLIFGWADFSQVLDRGVFAFPEPFAFGMPTFSAAAIISMFIVIIVTFAETTADIIAVGEIVKTKVDSKRISNGLRADMLSSAVSPIFNSFTQSAFAQNVGLVAITGVKSRFVVTAGGVILVVLGLLPVMGGVVAAIPSPVLGGAGIVLFGTVAASGIRTLSKVEYEGNLNMILVAVSLAFGIIPVVQPDFYNSFPSWVGIILHSGISSATLMAVLLNLVFNHIGVRSKDRTERSVFVAGTGRVIRRDELERLINHEALLAEGDTVKDGKIVDCNGEEVPVVSEQQHEKVVEAIKSGEAQTQDDVRRVIKETED